MRCRIETMRPCVLAVLAALGLAGCGGGGAPDLGLSSISTLGGVQPFPSNYRTELPSFLRTYLNDPRDIREAAIAEPAQRTVQGRQLYVACLRYNAKGPGGAYTGTRERAVVFVGGRLDRLIEDGSSFCSGATFGPYPDIEKLQR
ncbi:MAG: hypothetical protein A4S14_08370 [Proteobacteria bacterium SG_bin9]|nr:MAG: hypothetical protein A4S14_08370 [Proteobacteria bacterium SG_bin9]